MLKPRGDFGRLCFVVMAVDEIGDHMSGTGHTRHEAASLTRYYGAAMPNNASIEYFPAPVMNNKRKPPIMLRSL
jgi:hypothetical protein